MDKEKIAAPSAKGPAMIKVRIEPNVSIEPCDLTGPEAEVSNVKIKNVRMAKPHLPLSDSRAAFIKVMLSVFIFFWFSYKTILNFKGVILGEPSPGDSYIPATSNFKNAKAR